MMTMEQFMKRTGVRTAKTVQTWLEEGLIPGAERDPGSGKWQFSESSRRPHSVRLKPHADASKIRASMVYACIQRHHISPAIYQMSRSEFDALVKGLVEAGLVTQRREGAWVYYDSTPKSDELGGKTVRQVERFVKECLAVTVEAAAKGIAKAIAEQAA